MRPWQRLNLASMIVFSMSFLIFQEISGQIPSIPLNRKLFQIPDNIILADPEFHRPAEIDILVGAEYYYELLRSGKIHIPNQTDVLQETDLGWIIVGRYNKPPLSKRSVSCNLIKFQELPILWELEAENNVKLRSTEEEACESHYVNNIARDEMGRYISKLPCNKKKDSLGDSRNTAFQRFLL
ncbi:uncharacterized protein LOC117180153 [Belonocnema kinseyi]|uniref:uncharacterized protein LOC117180153 n=1 Tax=Belonocnema kinseyi TaxID=2817044 RepID=UPI00143CDA2A|nr:uncharacterized protein LOC117180153 [Belonocnema kinseyi]